MLRVNVQYDDSLHSTQTQFIAFIISLIILYVIVHTFALPLYINIIILILCYGSGAPQYVTQLKSKEAEMNGTK